MEVDGKTPCYARVQQKLFHLSESECNLVIDILHLLLTSNRLFSSSYPFDC